MSNAQRDDQPALASSNSSNDSAASSPNPGSITTSSWSLPGVEGDPASTFQFAKQPTNPIRTTASSPSPRRGTGTSDAVSISALRGTQSRGSQSPRSSSRDSVNGGGQAFLSEPAPSQNNKEGVGHLMAMKLGLENLGGGSARLSSSRMGQNPLDFHSQATSNTARHSSLAVQGTRPGGFLNSVNYSSSGGSNTPAISQVVEGATSSRFPSQEMSATSIIPDQLPTNPSEASSSSTSHQSASVSRKRNSPDEQDSHHSAATRTSSHHQSRHSNSASSSTNVDSNSSRPSNEAPPVTKKPRTKSNRVIGNLSAAFDVAAAELEQKETEITALKAQVNQANSDKESLKREMTGKVRAALKRSDQLQSNLNETVAAMRSSFNSIDKEMGGVHSIVELKAEIAELKLAIAQYQGPNGHVWLEKVEQTKVEVLRSLENEVAKRQAVIDLLRKELEVKTGEAAEARDRVNTLESQTALRVAAEGAHASQLMSLGEQLATSLSTISALGDSLRDAKDSIALAGMELEAKVQDLVVSNKLMEELEGKLGTSHGEVARLESELEIKKQELSARANEALALQEGLIQLKEEVASVKAQAVTAVGVYEQRTLVHAEEKAQLVEEHRQAISGLQASLEARNVDLRAMQALLEKESSHSNSLALELAKLKDSNATLQSENLNLTSLNSVLSDKARSADEDHEAYATKFTELQNSNAELKMQQERSRASEAAIKLELDQHKMDFDLKLKEASEAIFHAQEDALASERSAKANELWRANRKLAECEAKLKAAEVGEFKNATLVKAPARQVDPKPSEKAEEDPAVEGELQMDVVPVAGPAPKSQPMTLSALNLSTDGGSQESQERQVEDATPKPEYTSPPTRKNSSRRKPAANAAAGTSRSRNSKPVSDEIEESFEPLKKSAPINKTTYKKKKN